MPCQAMGRLDGQVTATSEHTNPAQQRTLERPNWIVLSGDDPSTPAMTLRLGIQH